MNKLRDEVITANDLTLGYRGHAIVSEMHFSIREGEFIGIFGPNGSGKSTFLRAVSGLIEPLAGDLLVLNERPEVVRKKIGYMPQLRNHFSVANFTSRTLLEATINGTRYGLPMLTHQQKAEVKNILEWVHAENYADRPFQQLSGGERQRIYLAQALLNQPSILLLDEPLAGLDPHYQEIFVELLTNIQKKLNVTVLFTAHDANPLLKIMDRVLYFAHGKVLMGTVNEVMTSEKLSALYGTPIDVINHRGRLIVLGEKYGLQTQGHHHD